MRHLSPLGFASAGALVGIIITALILAPRAAENRRLFLQHYGDTLATLAARQAVDATFNHDLVRLQVILQDITSAPPVALASIHDVENQLLVQAGDHVLRSDRAFIVSRPIVLQDSVAGHVTITLDRKYGQAASIRWMLGLFSAFMLSVLLWSLARDGVFSRNESIEAPLDANSSEEDTPEQEVKHEAAYVFAAIHVKNLDVLKEQLNGQNFRDTVARLERTIADVQALYGGQDFHLRENFYVLRFPIHNNRGEALFSAACSAYLVLELSGIIGKIPLDLAALIASEESRLAPRHWPFAGLLVEPEVLQDPLIEHRITFMEVGSDNGHHVIAEFRQPFQGLLEKQRKQLAQIL